MNIQDLRSLAPETTINTDICVVGSGPVGLTLAAELSGSGLEVVVLESGGRSPDSQTELLNTIESVGAERVLDQTLVRRRVFGGTSFSWSGRLAVFDDLDFEERPWVAGSGWPISRTEIARFFPRTLAHLGGAVEDNTDESFLNEVLGSSRNPRRLDSDLDDYLWSYSRDVLRPRDFMRFGPRAISMDFLGVSCFLHATVTHIDTTESGSAVTGVEVTGGDGQVRHVNASAVVLCTGGIENARLMLASTRIVRCGVGNAQDQVGRRLMDHPRGPIAFYDPTDFEMAQRAFGSYRRTINGTTAVLTRGYALSRSIQEREALLNCASWLDGTVAPADPFAAMVRLLRPDALSISGFGNVLTGAGLLVKGGLRVLQGRSPVRRLSSLNVTAILEQPPNPESRVTLADAVDALGMPLSRIDWRVGEQELRTIRRMAQLFLDESARLGLPLPRLLPAVTDSALELKLPDVAHPMGTTRMSTDPAKGVVDSNCAVHGVRGLYAAGTSTFPTSGHANPTQTALALSIRLADHLKSTLRHQFRTSFVSPTPHVSSPLRPIGPKGA